MVGVGVGGGGGTPRDYLVSTQLQLWLFCCWGCGCCWAVTITNILIHALTRCLFCLFVPLFEMFQISHRLLPYLDLD